jgi:hypothetical protein
LRSWRRTGLAETAVFIPLLQRRNHKDKTNKRLSVAADADTSTRPETLAIERGDVPVRFPGLVDARAISHDAHRPTQVILGPSSRSGRRKLVSCKSVDFRKGMDCRSALAPRRWHRYNLAFAFRIWRHPDSVR